jgi:hypothetical protein
MLVARTSAQISRENFPDFFIGGLWILLKERDEGHQEARCTESTLQSMSFPERLLERMKLFDCAQTLHSGELMPVSLDGEDQTSTHGLAVKQYRACSAHTVFAAYVCSCQPEVMPDEIA